MLGGQHAAKGDVLLHSLPDFLSPALDTDVPH